MSVPIVQSKSVIGTTASTVVTLDATPTVGNTLCAIMGADAYQTAAPTAGIGNSYTPRKSSENNLGYYMWTRKVVSGDSASTTFTLGTASSACSVVEVQGDYDVVSSTVTTVNNSAGGSIGCPGLTPTTADTLILAAAGLTSTNAVLSGASADNGFAIVTAATAYNPSSGGGKANVMVMSKATTSTAASGTTTISYTNLASDRTGAQIAFKALAGGGTYTGTLSASTPAVTAGVPTSAISGTTTVPTYTGSVAASTPAATAGIPTASIAGTTTVPTSTGAVSADTPTITAGPPTAAIAGTASVPVYTGAVAANAPTITAGAPTSSITGTATVPVYTGSIVASAPGVTAGPPTAVIAGTFIAPGGGTLNASAPTITVGPPVATMSGTYTAPAAVAGVLSAILPTVIVGPPVATITGATVVPVYAGTLNATLPVITVAVPLASITNIAAATPTGGNLWADDAAESRIWSQDPEHRIWEAS